MDRGPSQGMRGPRKEIRSSHRRAKPRRFSEDRPRPFEAGPGRWVGLVRPDRGYGLLQNARPLRGHGSGSAHRRELANQAERIGRGKRNSNGPKQADDHNPKIRLQWLPPNRNPFPKRKTLRPLHSGPRIPKAGPKGPRANRLTQRLRTRTLIPSRDRKGVGCSVFRTACLFYLVTQIVNKIIHRDPIRQRRPLLRIPRFVSALPSIAQIHVVADRDHDTPLVVANTPPMWNLAALTLLVSDSALEKLRAGHLKPLVEIEKRVEDRIVVGNILDGPVRENPLHAIQESRPLRVAVKIVAHEEAATQQEIP